MKMGEQLKNPLLVVRLDTDAIVSNRENVALVLLLDRDRNLRRIVGSELQGVREQILKNTLQLIRVSEDRGEFLSMDFSSGLLYGRLQGADRTIHKRIAITSLEPTPAGVDP